MAKPQQALNFWPFLPHLSRAKTQHCGCNHAVENWLAQARQDDRIRIGQIRPDVCRNILSLEARIMISMKVGYALTCLAFLFVGAVTIGLI